MLLRSNDDKHSLNKSIRVSGKEKNSLLTDNRKTIQNNKQNSCLVFSLLFTLLLAKLTNKIDICLIIPSI